MAPVVNFASREKADAGYQWGPRMIPDYQFFYVISGVVSLQLGSSTYTVKPGECVFYGPNHPHLICVHEPTDFYSIHFGWHSSSPIPVHPGYALSPVSLDELSGARLEEVNVTVEDMGTLQWPVYTSYIGVEDIMMRLVQEYRDALHGYPLMLRGLMTALLTTMLRQFSKPSEQPREGKIAAVLSAIMNRPGAYWNVAEMAALCGYHPSYFTQVFQREMGVNPKQYVINERIKLAKQALLRGESMETIAERLGYTSIHYFSNNFKKETGLSPSEFRQVPNRPVD
jgi:AraC-like DNA-binding protein